MTCFQLILFTIAQMQGTFTPCASASCCNVHPPRYRPRIEATFSAVSFDKLLVSPIRMLPFLRLIQCESPLGILSGFRAQPWFAPFDCLPLEHLSLTLSPCVPSERWDGFAHLRLSHLCITTIPSGMSPNVSPYDTRWAVSGRFSGLYFPYPVTGQTYPFHSQHSSGMPLETFSQNPAICRSERLTNSTPSVSEILASCMVVSCELLGRSGRSKRSERPLFSAPFLSANVQPCKIK